MYIMIHCIYIYIYIVFFPHLQDPQKNSKHTYGSSSFNCPSTLERMVDRLGANSANATSGSPFDVQRLMRKKLKLV